MKQRMVLLPFRTDHFRTFCLAAMECDILLSIQMYLAMQTHCVESIIMAYF